MAREIIIFGKSSWPYTQKAREAKTQEGYQVDFRDVLQYPDHLEEMLKISQGVRKVPVLVEDGKGTVGFGGTWKVWRTCRAQVQKIHGKVGPRITGRQEYPGAGPDWRKMPRSERVPVG
jgi:glutaredoxin 3